MISMPMLVTLLSFTEEKNGGNISALCHVLRDLITSNDENADNLFSHTFPSFCTNTLCHVLCDLITNSKENTDDNLSSHAVHTFPSF